MLLVYCSLILFPLFIIGLATSNSRMLSTLGIAAAWVYFCQLLIYMFR